MKEDRKQAVIANCAYCGEPKELVKSHAIPDALFKDLKKSTGGTLRQIHQDFGVHTTTTSGYAKLLCRDCEAHFNQLCDRKTVTAIRDHISSGKPSAIVHETVAQFICTVLWRACKSTAQVYSGYKITSDDLRRFEDVVFERKQPFDLFCFEVSRLVDVNGTLDDGQLAMSISAPYRAEITIAQNQHIIHHFHVRGIFMAAIFPKVPSVVPDYRYLISTGEGMPISFRDIRTLSNFRRIEGMAMREAFDRRS